MNTPNFKLKSEYIIILTLVLFSVLINGYHFGISGPHHAIVPFLNMHTDSSLFQNDILFSHLSESYLTYFFKVLSPIAKFIDINLLFFILYLLILFFSYFGVYLISRYFFDNKIIAYLAILFLIIPNPSLGTGILGRFVVETSNFTFPFLIFSIYFFLKERYIISLGLLGIAFNFHGMSSIHLLFMYLLYFLFKFNKIEKIQVASSLAIFLLFASPLLIWKFSIESTLLFYVYPLWFDLLKLVSSHHLFPLSWGIGKWLPFLTYMTLFGIALRYKPKIKKHGKVITFIKAILIIMIIGFVFIEIFPVSIFLSLQMFRVSIFLMLFALIYISNYLFVLYQEKTESKIAAIGFFTGLLLSNFKIILLFLIFLLYIKIKDKKFSASIFYIFIFVLFISVITSLFAIPYLSLFKIGHLASLVLILTITLFWIFMYFRKEFDQKRQLRLITIFIIIILLFISVSVVSVKNALYEGYNNGARTIAITGRMDEPYDPLSPARLLNVIINPKGYYNFNIHFPKIPQDNWLDVQIWVRDNVPKDAILIVPPYMSDFRFLSERAVVAQFLDGTFLNFDPEYGNVWYSTISDICNGLECESWNCLDYCRIGYDSLNEEDLQVITTKYHAEYIVIEKPKNINLNVIYENDGFLIYRN